MSERQMTMRERFEAWVIEELDGSIDFEIDEDGHYHDWPTQRAWRAWQAALQQEPSVCKWTLDEDIDAWETSCGETYSFNDGTPAENGVVYCHHCGKKADFDAAPVERKEDGS